MAILIANTLFNQLYFEYLTDQQMWRKMKQQDQPFGPSVAIIFDERYFSIYYDKWIQVTQYTYLVLWDNILALVRDYIVFPLRANTYVIKSTKNYILHTCFVHMYVRTIRSQQRNAFYWNFLC